MEHQNELFEIFAGTYEEYMLGFKFFKRKDDGYKLEQTVADHSHKGSIRAISSKGYLLATGGFDEIIHVYNLDENREVGTLAQHTGTVTCLAFTSDEKHLVSCSEDGTIAIYRVGSWIMEKLWNKAHKGTHVNWISVHPSNKMAFSVGNDGNLRTWNLIDGTPAFVTNISHLTKRPELVVWSPSGELYAIPHDNSVSVYDVQTTSIRHEFKLESKVTCAQFLKDEKLVVGDIVGNLILSNLQKKTEKMHLVADARIKAIVSHNDNLIAATSQGLVVAYEITDDGLMELARIDSGCRITCLAVSCHCHRRERKPKKKKLKTNEDIKTENSIEVKPKKSSSDKTVQMAKKSSGKTVHIGKVVYYPPRQSWIVEELDTS